MSFLASSMRRSPLFRSGTVVAVEEEEDRLRRRQRLLIVIRCRSGWGRGWRRAGTAVAFLAPAPSIVVVVDFHFLLLHNQFYSELSRLVDKWIEIGLNLMNLNLNGQEMGGIVQKIGENPHFSAVKFKEE